MITNFFKSKAKQFQPQFRYPGREIRRWFGLSVERRNALNNAVIDDKLMPWGHLLRRHQSGLTQRSKGSFHVLFPHIPKTGGTTLDYLIAKNYKVDFIYRINAHALDRNIAGMYKLHKSFVPHRVIMGHFELNDIVYQLLNRERMVHLVMLREPVSRVISYYDYLRTSPNHPKHALARSMTLAEFVDSDRIDEINNAQTHRLLGALKFDRWRAQSSDEVSLLKAAKHQLMHRYSLFGLVEEYDAFLLMAHQLLNWSDVYYQRKNTSKTKTARSDVPAEVIQRIRENNRLDLMLYQFACVRFAERKQQLNINQLKIDEFRANNKHYAQLLQHPY